MSTPPTIEISSRRPAEDISDGNNGDDEGGHTYISRLVLKILKALKQLGCFENEDELYEDNEYDDDDEDKFKSSLISKIESISIFIHESMSIGSRNYHSVQHVFDILSSSTDEAFRNDPIATLAIIFHDCVYYNIDGGLSSSQSEKLKGAFVEVGGNDDVGHGGHPNRRHTTHSATPAKLRTHPDSDSDPLLSMVLQIYGFKAGQDLNPMGGQNEYLSAVIAVRELAPLLSPPILAQIATCIEATIPFRLADPITKKLPMERLYDNLKSTVSRLNLALTDAEMVQAVQRSVLLTNEDVANFATSDQGWFLDNTWSLLPESNEALRDSFLYTACEFQFAVFKMYGFFSFLQPHQIFQKFRGVPTDQEWDLRTERAKQNLLIGKEYIAAKLLSISVLAAIAILTGGDAPISLFMGDLPSRNRESKRLEDSLGVEEACAVDTKTNRRNSIIVPMKESACPPHCNAIVYRLLTKGRTRETTFDVKQSPLAAYFYWHLGDDKTAAILKKVKVYPMDSIVAKELLLALPRDTVLYVAEKISPLATSRTHRIEQVMKSLYDTSG